MAEKKESKKEKNSKEETIKKSRNKNKESSNKEIKRKKTAKKTDEKDEKKTEKKTEKKDEKKIAKKTEKKDEKKIEKKNENVIKLEEIENTLKEKNKIPKEKIEEIYSSIFKNIVIAVVIVIYFIFINLGQINIKTDIYQTDLKVFSIISLLISIILFERAYKDDNSEIAIYGIEVLILALTTLALIYVNLIVSTKYVFIVNAISCIFATYYLIKTTVIYVRKRKKCYIQNMKEIINKDEE